MNKARYLLALAMAALTLSACLKVIAYDSKETIDGAERSVIVYPNYFVENTGRTWTEVVAQPSCGQVTPVVVGNLPAFMINRSTGMAKGTYKFDYVLHVVPKIYEVELTSRATIEVTFTETVPSPDGQPPCGAQYQAFLQGANDSGSGSNRTLSVSWRVPELSEFADSYHITVTDAKSGATLATTSYAPPSDSGLQVANISHSPVRLLNITLDTIFDGQVVFTDTLTVQGAPMDFIVVDEYITLEKGVTERTILDPLENDYDISASSLPLRGWARLDGAGIAVVDPDGMIIHKVVGERGNLMLGIILGPDTVLGEHKITLRIDKAGYNSQHEYIYVDVKGPQFVIVEDHLTLERGVTNMARVDVMANNYIPEQGSESGGGFINPRVAVVDPAGLDIRREIDAKGNTILAIILREDTEAGQHTVLLRVSADGWIAQYERLYVDVTGPDFVAVDDYVQLVKGVDTGAFVDALANDYIPGQESSQILLNEATAIVVDSAGLIFHKIVDERGRVLHRVILAPSTAPGQYTAVYKLLHHKFNPQYSKLFVDVIEPLVANDDIFAGSANLTVNLPVLRNDTTYDNSPLTIIGFSQPDGASVASSEEALSIKGPAGTYVFGYTIEDQHGNQASANVSVTLVEEPAQNPCEVNPFNPNC